uniref:Uncharacterized protein n=1 Tax=Arundo donax TaxID=35708 RepID=A0A0A8ZT79_ARUDO
MFHFPLAKQEEKEKEGGGPVHLPTCFLFHLSLGWPLAATTSPPTRLSMSISFSLQSRTIGCRSHPLPGPSSL